MIIHANFLQFIDFKWLFIHIHVVSAFNSVVSADFLAYQEIIQSFQCRLKNALCCLKIGSGCLSVVSENNLHNYKY